SHMLHAATLRSDHSALAVPGLGEMRIGQSVSIAPGGAAAMSLGADIIDAMEIDLNCDLGEGCGSDAELLTLVTSAISGCGFHAGDPSTAAAALREAKRHGVRVGAHPSFPDREHFGRQEMTRSEPQIFDDVVYQVGALAGLAQAAGIQLSHLKPHGALYNM